MTLEEKIAEFIALGLSPERAELAARIELGESDGDVIEHTGGDDAGSAEDD